MSHMEIRDESIDAAVNAGNGWSRTRKLVLGMLLAVGMFAVLPVAASQGAVVFSLNAGNNNINGSTQTFGPTVSTSETPKTIYFYSNDIVGFSSTNRRSQVTLGSNAAFEPVPGSGCNLSPVSATVFNVNFSQGALSASGSCNFQIRMKSGLALGNYSTTMTWTNQGSGASGSATLTGSVTAENGSVVRTYLPSGSEGSSFDFGTIAVTDSSSRTFTYKNTGTTAVTGLTTTLSAPQPSSYSITATTCGTSLAVNSQCTATVRYAPTAEVGNEPKTLNFASTSHGTKSIGLSGQGLTPVADISVTPMSHDYGITPVGFPFGKSYTVTNTGNTTLDVTTAIDSGTDPAVYSRTGGTCGTNLAVGLSCTVIISFSPSASGAAVQPGSFTVSGATFLLPNPATETVTVTGTRGAATSSIQPQDTAGVVDLAAKDIGSASIGGTTNYTFSVRNTGNIPVPNITPSLSGPNASRFSVVGTTCNSTVGREGTCTVTVQFSATAGGLARANLTLTPGASSPQAATKAVAITAHGTGVRIINDVNANLTGVNHKRWLDTLSLGGAQSGGDRVRVAFEVEKGDTDLIEDVLISTSLTTTDSSPDAGTFIPIPGGIGRVEVQTQDGGTNALVIGEVPGSTIFGGNAGTYGFNDDSGSIPIVNLPYTCGILGDGGTSRSSDRRAWFRVRTASGALSQPVGSIIRFTDGRRVCGGGPLIFDQQVNTVGGVTQPTGKLNAVAGKNEAVSFGFKGSAAPKAADANGTNGFFTGINWRIRNSRTGDMFRRNGSSWVACAAPCNNDGDFTTGAGSRVDFADQTPGVAQTLSIPIGMPSRGRWVVEGAPRGTNQDLAYFQQIGSVLVNSVGTSPTISFSSKPPLRPATNSDWTVTAAVSDPLDPSNAFDTQGGRAQVIEWDLNNNTTDGPLGDGFETRYEGTASDPLPAAYLTEPFTTQGKAPGSYTIRARVTDNGGITAGDNARRSAIESYTFTINSPPEAITETIDLEADQDQPAPIEFRANDADNDPYTVDVTPDPGNAGSVSGSGNTKDYNWPAAFTGSDEFDFHATDDKNGVGPTGTLTVRVRPNTTIDVAAPNGTNAVPGDGYLGASTETEAEFDFSSPQSPVVAYECRLLNDGDVVEDWTECSNASTGSYDYADLEDGLHRFEVRAINDEGQKDGTPAFRTWRVDNTTPVTEIRIAPPTDQPTFQPRPTNDPTPEYAFEAVDRAPMEFITYECRILSGPEAGNWKSCGAPSDSQGSALVQFAGAGTDFGYEEPFEEGVYQIEIRATDDVGLTGPVLSESFRIDLTPPTTSIASGPDGLINTRDVTFQVTSTEANSSFMCELTGDQQGVVFASAPCPGGTSPNFTGLADDIYQLQITAIDPATNPDPNPPVAEFEIDATEPVTTGPDVDFGDGVTADRETRSRRITVDFGGTDNRQMDGFNCRLDSDEEEDWTICAPPETYSGLTDGDHTLEVRSRDEAGNVDSSPLLVEWEIDNEAPVTAIDAAPDNVNNDTNPSIEFTSDSDTEVSKCKLDGGSWTDCSSPVSMSSLNGGPLADGPHSFSVYSIDIAGNAEGTPATTTWLQDTVLPVVAITGKPPEFGPRGDSDFGWTVKDGSPPVDSPESQAECSIDSGAWEECGRSLTVTDPSNGEHTFSVRATDAAGNVSDVESHTWEILGEPPVAPNIDNSDPAAGTTTRLDSASFAFSHEGENEGWFGGFECKLDGGPWGACESPHAIDGLDDGAHTFSVRARDVADNLSPETTRSWEIQSSAPVTTIDSGPSGLTRQRGTTIIFSSNKPGTFECKMGSDAWAACTSPLTLSDLEDGQYAIKVRAVSSVAPVGIKDPTPPSRSWTVDGTAPGTTLGATPATPTKERDAQFTFTSDDDTAAFQCKVDAKPWEHCASPLSLSNLEYGSHTVDVRAIDEAGNLDETPGSATWTITAPEPPKCPVGQEGTPPNCTVIPPVQGDKLVATLNTGTLTVGVLGEVELPANQLVLTGSINDKGNWAVPMSGAEFLPIEQSLPIEGLGQADVKITLKATGPGVGKLPNGGGDATLELPVEAKLEAKLNGNVLVGPEVDCAVRPIQFSLTGTYDEAAKSVTVGSEEVAFPTVSAGCGSFVSGIVNGLLALPRNDIAIAMTFGLVRSKVVDPPPPPTPGTAKITATVKGAKKVKSGKTHTVRVSLANSGDATATAVKVCARSPRKLVKGAGNRCVKVADVEAGKSRTATIRFKTKKGKKGKKAKFQITTSYIASAAAGPANTRSTHVTRFR